MPHAFFVHVFAAPPQCPSYDVVVLRKTPDVLEAVFFECTVNVTQSDSFLRFTEHKAVGGRTQLERSVDALRAFYPEFCGTVDVKFVWVLEGDVKGDGASMELHDWNQEAAAKRPSRTIALPGHPGVKPCRPLDGVLAALDRVLHGPASFVAVSGPTVVDAMWLGKPPPTGFAVTLEEYAVRISRDTLR
jgi:hypothetical protein